MGFQTDSSGRPGLPCEFYLSGLPTDGTYTGRPGLPCEFYLSGLPTDDTYTAICACCKLGMATLHHIQIMCI